MNHSEQIKIMEPSQKENLKLLFDYFGLSYQGESGNKSALNELLETSFGKDLGVPYHDEHPDNHLENVITLTMLVFPFQKC